MNPGEDFEIWCYEYLKNTYGDKAVKFERKGGMDSTESDIAVKKNNAIDYFIEAKESSAQSGQFVLFPDEEKREFVFSLQNHSKANLMTQIIIEYMNSNFDRFSNAGTAGEKIDINSSVFSDWIINLYTDKNVKYVISYNDSFVILPIRRFADYFNVFANYRVKKSGSSNPAKKDFPSIKSAILKMYPNASFHEEDKRLFTLINSSIDEDRFIFGNYTYYLSKQNEQNLYRVKKLSNTNNMNVIFSIQLKKNQDPNDLSEFESDL